MKSISKQMKDILTSNTEKPVAKTIFVKSISKQMKENSLSECRATSAEGETDTHLWNICCGGRLTRTVEKSSTSLSSGASNSPETLKAHSENLGLIASTGRPAPKDSNENTASSSQVWQQGVNPTELMCGGPVRCAPRITY